MPHVSYWLRWMLQTFCQGWLQTANPLDLSIPSS
jgi:hypothetical protein